MANAESGVSTTVQLAPTGRSSITVGVPGVRVRTSGAGVVPNEPPVQVAVISNEKVDGSTPPGSPSIVLLIVRSATCIVLVSETSLTSSEEVVNVVPVELVSSHPAGTVSVTVQLVLAGKSGNAGVMVVPEAVPAPVGAVSYTHLTLPTTPYV